MKDIQWSKIMLREFEYRKTHGAPPAAMMAVYEYLHNRSVEKLAEAKRYQEVYKNT